MKKTCLLLWPLSGKPARALVGMGGTAPARVVRSLSSQIRTGRDVELVDVFVGADEEDVLTVVAEREALEGGACYWQGWPRGTADVDNSWAVRVVADDRQRGSRGSSGRWVGIGSGPRWSRRRRR